MTRSVRRGPGLIAIVRSCFDFWYVAIYYCARIGDIHTKPLDSMRTTLLIVGIVVFLGTKAQVQFQNVSTPAGLTYQGRTYGSSWGDINGDGLFDLFMSCHENKADFFSNDSIRIYKNMGNGVFDDGIYLLDNGHQSDFHGGVFFDHDNDGDQDMLIVNGGTKQNIFLINDGSTQLMDHADDVNIALNKSRGRQSTFLDANNDGLTDVIVNNEDPYDPLGLSSVLLIAHPGIIYQIDSTCGFEEPFSIVSCISDLDGNKRTDVVTANAYGLDIYSVSPQGVFTLENHLDISNITDISIADFDGDQKPDIFVARGLTQDTDIQQFGDSSIYASCRVSPSRPKGEGTFTTTGPIEVSLLTFTNVPFNVRIGSNTSHLGLIGNPLEPFHTYLLDPDSMSVHGFQELDMLPPGLNCSLGLLPGNVWKFSIAKNTPAGATAIMQIKSHHAINDFVSTGTPIPDETSRDLLLLNQGGFQFIPSTDPAFTLDEFSISATAGDFDNDMDNDIVVMASGRVKNRKAHVYENMGNGTFTVHENGWGIIGDVAGVGDAVTNSDFNNDGFLDLFVTNGSTNFFLDTAGVDLYQNQGNGNKWITLKLTGTLSNKDGFGAVVSIQADGVSQIANMTGGIHTACQDDPRIHFGLGSASHVDTIRVTWPSGLVDLLVNVDVDQILEVVEGDHLGTGVDGPTAVATTTITDLVRQGAIDHVTIHNAMGQLVRTVGLLDRELRQEDLRFSPGLYFLAYADKGNKIVVTKKLVIP